MTALAAIFWLSAALLLYTHIGYAGVLSVLAWWRGGAGGGTLPQAEQELPSVSVIVAAYAEQDVIADRVANLAALDYPRERLEIIVACDGSPDATPARARAAGADVVLELPRGGKVRAQDAAVRRARGDIVAFSDANTAWQADALRRLVAPFVDPRVGYVCGEVRLVNPRSRNRSARGSDSREPSVGGNADTINRRARAGNQEGLYWRYEMALRSLESRVRSVTAGNGAIYATRRDAYLFVDPIMGHDLSFPFNMVKRGRLALFARDAQAVEKMVPSIEGEFSRKRRMMSHTWPIVVRGGMLSPRGYDPLYALMIVSHRGLRYLSPFLHGLALVTSLVLVGHGWVYALAAALQLAVLAAALLAGAFPARPLLIARYYVLTTFSLAAGLWDWLTVGTKAGWEPAEGTR